MKGVREPLCVKRDLKKKRGKIFIFASERICLYDPVAVVLCVCYSQGDACVFYASSSLHTGYIVQ